jgi:hypothetical protein
MRKLFMLRKKSRVKPSLKVGLSVLGVLSSVTLASPTLATIASFDNFSEGFSGTTLTDAGVTFFDLNQGLSELLPYTFYIDTTTENYLGSSFSPPNYLTFGSFAEGADAAFGRFSSMSITTGNVESSVSLDLFSQLFYPSNAVLTLEALQGGSVVASTSASVSDFEVVGNSDLRQQTLSIRGLEFDELRLSAAGTEEDSVAFIGVDNVRISVPEPTSVFGILVLGALGASSALRHKHKSVE